MRKSIELKKLIDAQRAKVESLQAQELIDEATKEAKALNDLVAEFRIADAMEQAENAQLFNGATPVDLVANMNDAKFRNRVFNKAVFGEKFGLTLTDEEKEYAQSLLAVGQAGKTPAKGGYLLTEEGFNTIKELRRAYVALKDYCNIANVTSRTGKQPTIGSEDGKLIAFDELTEINRDDLDFGQIEFAVKSYGDIIPVANELLEDIDVDLIALIGTRFVRKAINTENAQILTLIDAIDKTAGTSYKNINTALNKTLNPAISLVAKIFTNQSGFDYLDNLEDKNGRPMLSASLADATRMVYKGREVVVLPDALLNSAEGKNPFIVGSMADFATFYDKKAVEIALSTEAGFSMNSTLLRAIERFDVKPVDTEALVSIEIATA